ncbi:hypothetical protein OIV83_004011 [Microbotryomycetes sp. JL201]|nr:hypothetical protein OIV83_004011 [Microbotryomycetes sp. JL201]
MSLVTPSHTHRESSPLFGFNEEPSSPLGSSGADALPAIRRAPAPPTAIHNSKTSHGGAFTRGPNYVHGTESDLILTPLSLGASGPVDYTWSPVPSTTDAMTRSLVKTEPISSYDPMSSYPFATTALDDFSVSPLPMLGANASPSLLQHRALTFDATLESPLDAGYDSPDGSSDFQTSPFDDFLQAPMTDYSSSLFDPASSLAASTSTIKAETAGPLSELFPDLSLSAAIKDADDRDADSTSERGFAPPPVRDDSLYSSNGHIDAQLRDDGEFQAEDDDDEEPSAQVRDGEDDDEYVPGTFDGSKSAVKRRSRKRKSPSSRMYDDDDEDSLPSSKRHSTGPRPPSVVPVDAPIQPRVYKGESKTSRKVLPKAMAKSMAAHKNRQKSVAAGSAEADEIDDVTRAMVDQRRQQNTIAARKSRERKAQHLAGLEEAVDRLTEENQMLKQRLMDAGLPID